MRSAVRPESLALIDTAINADIHYHGDSVLNRLTGQHNVEVAGLISKSVLYSRV